MANGVDVAGSARIVDAVGAAGYAVVAAIGGLRNDLAALKAGGPGAGGTGAPPAAPTGAPAYGPQSYAPTVDKGTDALKRQTAAARETGRAVGGIGSGGGGPLETVEAGSKSLKYLAKQFGISKAALRAPLTAGAVDLTKLALGQRSMAMLSYLGTKAGFQLRQLFKGIDSSPVVKGAARFLQIFDKASVTGQALSGIFHRVFGGLFSEGEKLGDVAHTAFQGFVLGALYAELYALKAAKAVKPLTDIVGGLADGIDGMKIAAYAGGAAFAYLAFSAGAAGLSLPIALAKIGGAAVMGSARLIALGLSATGAAAPFIALGAAILAVGAALDQALKLKREWDAGGADAIEKSKAGVGAAGEKAWMGKSYRDDADLHLSNADYAAKYGGGAGAPKATDTGAPGAASGKSYADGVVKGVAAGTPAVDAAGRALAGTVDAGFRAEAKIKSPSVKAEESAAFIPAGTVRGLDGGRGDVRAAAGRLAAESMPGGGTGGGAAPSSGPASVSLVVNVAMTGSGSIEADARALARRVVYEEFRAVLMGAGIPVRP